MRQKSQHEKIGPAATAGKPGRSAPMNEKDSLYLGNIEAPADFVFDDRVVRVFPDMINRSVPGYGLVVPMTAMLARRYAQDGSTIYDLGCSLGAVALAMRQEVVARDVRIVAVDNSRAMIERCRKTLDAIGEAAGPRIELQQGDVRETAIENASVVALNFTLQFIDIPERNRLLERMRRGMRPGGILVLSEKIRFDDEQEQELQTDWHHEFKRTQGYSELEIARKRDALERVLTSESLPEHRARLRNAGFARIVPWFQAFNFVSLVAFA